MSSRNDLKVLFDIRVTCVPLGDAQQYKIAIILYDQSKKIILSWNATLKISSGGVGKNAMH